MEKNKLNIIARLLKQFKAKNVLDIGCYNLRQYEAIKKIKYKIDYVGIDVKENDWKKYFDEKIGILAAFLSTSSAWFYFRFFTT